MPELNDPEHCNALASTLWEFALLKVLVPLAFPRMLLTFYLQHHYHPYLNNYVADFLKFFEKVSFTLSSYLS